MHRPVIVCAAVLSMLFLGSTAQAERGNPGSLLVFPEYDNSAAALSLFTVTNTNTSNGVDLAIYLMDGESCLESVFVESVGPGDTFSFFTSALDPLNTGSGYGFIYALGQSGPINFDYLIGQATIMDGLGGFSTNMEVFSFKAGADLAPLQSTDLNANGRRDFDGLEYEPLPNRVMIPRFMGQDAGQYDDDLILISFSGARQFTTTLGFLAYNDNSEVFSLEYSFNCWERVPLASVSLATSNSFLHNFTGHDLNEIVGLTAREAGWLRIDGLVATSSFDVVQDPAFLAVLVGGTAHGSYSVLPFEEGTQPNGSLFEVGLQLAAPPGTRSCPGTTGTCHCNNQVPNFASSGDGCRNSTGVGARLDGVGTNSFGLDNLRLQVSQAAPNASGFFLQGGSQISLTLGDGRLCIGPPTRRLQFKQTDVHGQAMSSISLASFVTPGATVEYQFWFREPSSAGPCGRPSNLSSGYRVTWN